MDYSLSLHKTLSFPYLLRSAVKSKGPSHLTGRSFNSGGGAFIAFGDWKFTAVIASTGASHCDFSSLNAPLEPRSAPGKLLSSVLLNQRQFFHFAAADELKQLAGDRDAACERMSLSSGSDEACLHRRIAQLKEYDCQIAVEDIMYMMIFFKFSEIKVPLVPKLSRCIYNGRLEIWPSKDWELESIHNFEVLEMVREHISTVIGLRANSSVTDNWATTEIRRLQLGRVYAASILYGYFLRSATLRYHLEMCLALAPGDLHLVRRRTSLHFTETFSSGFKNLIFGCSSKTQPASLGKGPTRQEKKLEQLRCYVMGFDPETLQRCARLKSKEAINLIEKQSCALFGDETTGSLETNEVILTSFSSLKRLVLEAVAFGTFLWDIEEYVNSVYKLKEN